MVQYFYCHWLTSPLAFIHFAMRATAQDDTWKPTKGGKQKSMLSEDLDTEHACSGQGVHAQMCGAAHNTACAGMP
jgi:hypothetical protein